MKNHYDTGWCMAGFPEYHLPASRQKIKLDQQALDSNLVPALMDGHATEFSAIV
jgi:hypothetical protein